MYELTFDIDTTTYHAYFESHEDRQAFSREVTRTAYADVPAVTNWDDSGYGYQS